MLDARVVINITAFYTYMKAVRDAMRSLAEIRVDTAEGNPQISEVAALEAWQDGMRNVFFLLFLGLESARHAISDLVEFEPEQAERTIVILISELPAYHFLRQQFTDAQDMRHQRLMLRASEYDYLVPDLCLLVETRLSTKPTNQLRQRLSSLGPEQREPAWLLLAELRKRCDAATRG